ncbi:MAG: hypothetical protein P1U53_13710 [Sulfitobacter sp.]|nr:hypothetical protein [Sulfitobacter sp.]
MNAMTETGDLTLKELLARLSREMDRFPVLLTAIEAEVADLIGDNPEKISNETNRVLQTIDYMTQASVAISDLLSQSPDADPRQLHDLVRRVIPGDLSDRLQNVGLEDIDNARKRIEFF